MKHLIILVIGGLMIISCAGQRSEKLGIKDGQLLNCPSKPNCVNSQAINKDQIVLPFRYSDEKELAVKRLKEILASYDRATIVTENENYLLVEFKTKIMGFVDDVEFYFPQKKVIHVRSASRLGYSDFGVNRKRVEQLRNLFQKE